MYGNKYKNAVFANFFLARITERLSGLQVFHNNQHQLAGISGSYIHTTATDELCTTSRAANNEQIIVTMDLRIQFLQTKLKQGWSLGQWGPQRCLISAGTCVPDWQWHEVRSASSSAIALCESDKERYAERFHTAYLLSSFFVPLYVRILLIEYQQLLLTSWTAKPIVRAYQ